MNVSGSSTPCKIALEDLSSPAHTKHSLVQTVRQRAHQIAAGDEDCHNADYLRLDPALRPAIDKGHEYGASQLMLCRFENDVLGNAMGLTCIIRDQDNRGSSKRFLEF
jgi:hypothetical protein